MWIPIAGTPGFTILPSQQVCCYCLNGARSFTLMLRCYKQILAGKRVLCIVLQTVLKSSTWRSVLTDELRLPSAVRWEGNRSTFDFCATSKSILLFFSIQTCIMMPLRVKWLNQFLKNCFLFEIPPLKNILKTSPTALRANWANIGL